MQVKEIIREMKDRHAVVFNSNTRAIDNEGDQVEVPLPVQVLDSTHYDFILQQAAHEKQANGVVPRYLTFTVQKGKVYLVRVETDSRDEALVEMHESEPLVVNFLEAEKIKVEVESLEAEKKDKRKKD